MMNAKTVLKLRIAWSIFNVILLVLLVTLFFPTHLKLDIGIIIFGVLCNSCCVIFSMHYYNADKRVKKDIAMCSQCVFRLREEFKRAAAEQKAV